MRRLKLSVVLFLLLSVCRVVRASSLDGDGFNECETIVKKWASSTLETKVREDKILRDFLFFLHIPRTGGRTYYHCFLKKLYPDSLECPRSYDKLRFDPRKSKCHLLVTHDDYSMMNKFQEEKTSVVTILRDPVDRIFSAYEFSIEVAARFLVHPNLTSALRMTKRLRMKTKGVGISTLDIWPWKYLVPWMREDLFARRDGRKRRGRVSMDNSDPYNMEDFAMPLKKYINDPVARDIIHNGATFQIAGLTNNSHLVESHDVRHCALKYQSLGKYVLEVAKKRLDDMLYVGLTENHRESATIFADVVGAQVISQFSGGTSVAANLSEKSSSIFGSDSDAIRQLNNITDQLPRRFLNRSVEASNGNMTAEELMNVYESCISTLRTTQSQRRTNSLHHIYPANFTKELIWQVSEHHGRDFFYNQARRQVPRVLLEKIALLNHLDVELYKYAQGIFAKQQKHNKVPTLAVAEQQVESTNTTLNKSYAPFVKLVYIALSSLLLLMCIYIFVYSRRTTSKLKL